MNNDPASPSVGAGQKENDDVARKYRKVDPAKWDDEWYVAQDDAMRNLWDLLLTGPQVRVVPGLQLCGPASLAELLRRPFETVSKLFQKLIDDGKIEFDASFRLVRIPNAPKYNAPENLNQLKGWFNSWLELPESRLKYEHIPALAATLQGADATLVNEFRKGFETVWKQFRTLEQDLEQEQEQDHHGEPAAATTMNSSSNGTSKPAIEALTSLPASTDSQTAPKCGSSADHQPAGKAATKSKGSHSKPKASPQRQLTIAATETGSGANGDGNTVESPIEATRRRGWGLWKDAWADCYGAGYVNSPQDGRIMETLIKSALDAAGERGLDAAAECLEYWFRAFLDDKGHNNRIAEERHPLSWLPKSLNKYGLPWSRPTEKSVEQQYREIRLPTGGGSSSLAAQASEHAPELKNLLRGGLGLQPVEAAQ